MMNRREFIRTNAIALSTALFYSRLEAFGLTNYTPDNIASLSAAFEEAAGPRPFTLWQWINGCVTKEGITSDLEAFKKAGITDVQQFLIGGSEADVTDPEITVLGSKWMTLMRFALDECRRLGMTFGTHNCPGWSASGAPGITPGESMQQLVWTKILLNSKDSLSKTIPKPHVDARWNYYNDICIVAVPSGGEIVNKSNVLVLADYLTPSDKLREAVPEGDWIIFRFGHTTTGHKNGTAPVSGIGLEVDKLSKEAVNKFWELYPAKLIEMAGDHAGTTFKRIESDSYEAGEQTWTPKMPQEFKQRCGYNLLSWLPVLAGVTIESKEWTDRFKQDWQQTLNQLFAENYYAHLNSLIHQKPGMEFLIQPYGTGSSNFNFSSVRGIGDIPMCEFWWGPTTWGWDSIMPVASNSHVNGKKLVAAEAFTGQPQFAWKVDLFDLKAAGDRAFCKGVNLFVLHASAHQPYPNVKPGMTMGWWGTQFGPSQTWWEHGAAEWIQYLSRCQMLLQQGLYVADICFLHLSKQKDPVFPAGYQADICNQEEFLSRFDVKNNAWVLPDGMEYKVMVIPNDCLLELSLAKKMEQLIKKGGVIIGNGFKGSVGLKGLAAEVEIKQISERLFGKPTDGTFSKKTRIVGKGKVYTGHTLHEVLQQEQIEKDVAWPKNEKNILWTHRANKNEHVYFLANEANAVKEVQIAFRVTGQLPELWNPETGLMVKAPVWETSQGKTRVTLRFEAFGAVFVVFRDATHAQSGITAIKVDGQAVQAFDYLFIRKGRPFIRLKQTGTYTVARENNEVKRVQLTPPAQQVLNHNWTVSFQEKRGAPKKAAFDKLISLTKHPDKGIKYFSGKAIYSKEFLINAAELSAEKGIFLDLGEIKNVATIRINGKKVITFWKPPFATEITSWCKAGKNNLTVEVTNLWPNRMIGDEQEPDDCIWGEDRYFGYVTPRQKIGNNLQVIPDWVKENKQRPSQNRITFSSMKFFQKDDPLLPSGLLGPVTVSIEYVWKIA